MFCVFVLLWLNQSNKLYNINSPFTRIRFLITLHHIRHIMHVKNDEKYFIYIYNIYIFYIYTAVYLSITIDKNNTTWLEKTNKKTKQLGTQ